MVDLWVISKESGFNVEVMINKQACVGGWVGGCVRAWVRACVGACTRACVHGFSHQPIHNSCVDTITIKTLSNKYRHVSYGRDALLTLHRARRGLAYLVCRINPAQNPSQSLKIVDI